MKKVPSFVAGGSAVTEADPVTLNTGARAFVTSSRRSAWGRCRNRPAAYRTLLHLSRLNPRLFNHWQAMEGDQNVRTLQEPHPRPAGPRPCRWKPVRMRLRTVGSELVWRPWRWSGWQSRWLRRRPWRGWRSGWGRTGWRPSRLVWYSCQMLLQRRRALELLRPCRMTKV